MYRREVLDQKTRELCAVAASTLLASPDQIASHTRAALRMGASVEETREAVIQMVVYGGFPRVLTALKTWKATILDEGLELPPAPRRGPTPSKEQVEAAARKHTEAAIYPPADNRGRFVYGDINGPRLIAEFNNWDADWGWLFQRFVYGGIYDRKVINQRTRQLLTVAACTIQNAIPQLEGHIRGALRAGATYDEVKETILQMSVYAGLPYMLQAMRHFLNMKDLPESGAAAREGKA
jgi:4-carboxymuconolactone decarboxylase